MGEQPWQLGSSSDRSGGAAPNLRRSYFSGYVVTGVKTNVGVDNLNLTGV